MSKPAFDPKKPFDAIETSAPSGEKPAFDPQKPFEAAEDASSSETGKFDALMTKLDNKERDAFGGKTYIEALTAEAPAAFGSMASPLLKGLKGLVKVEQRYDPFLKKLVDSSSVAAEKSGLKEAVKTISKTFLGGFDTKKMGKYALGATAGGAYQPEVTQGIPKNGLAPAAALAGWASIPATTQLAVADSISKKIQELTQNNPDLIQAIVQRLGAKRD